MAVQLPVLRYALALAIRRWWPHQWWPHHFLFFAGEATTLFGGALQLALLDYNSQGGLNNCMGGIYTRPFVPLGALLNVFHITFCF